jgi:hypothetical protein
VHAVDGPDAAVREADLAADAPLAARLAGAISSAATA